MKKQRIMTNYSCGGYWPIKSGPIIEVVRREHVDPINRLQKIMDYFDHIDPQILILPVPRLRCVAGGKRLQAHASANCGSSTVEFVVETKRRYTYTSVFMHGGSNEDLSREVVQRVEDFYHQQILK